ncbi:calcium ATPase [Linderina pennispora]|uniref:Calcium ATPase n=1 Tax=Linderina pennispora TaxID=61395 RepID=A0A1Y1WLR1_9FUNG|nr:calcium ATPase [Linderina pennispora]ORX74432.1 calcium ATPase [Linderina pennispora]
MNIGAVQQDLNVNIENGLSTSEAEKRLAEYGTNEMRGGGRPSAFKIPDWIEAAVVIAIIILNTAIGFFQEFKAEKTMDSLRKMSSPTSRVLRNGHQIVDPYDRSLFLATSCISRPETVVGADCRLFEALPISKEVDSFTDPELPLGDRINLAAPKAVVYATGMASEVGKIAKKLMESDKPKKTPLQRGLDKMAWVLLGVAIISVLIVFGVNKFKISNEVWLPIVTLTMALGVHTLAKKRALVRQLVALESLGSVTNICSDKTGTLTQSKMVMVRAWLPIEGFFRVAGLGFEPVGEVTTETVCTEELKTDVNFETEPLVSDSKKTVVVTKDNMSPVFRRLTEAAALCNMSEIKKDQETGDWFGIGDPTELSMGKPTLTNDEHQWKIVCEYPFDSSIKRMSVVIENRITGEKLLVLKGATERVVPCCSAVQEGRHVVPISPDQLQPYLDPQVESMARDGLRVLSIAFRPLTEHELTDVEQNMTFLGLVGIYDPPRPESRPSVLECYRAGIQVTMLTGDHPETAAAIARQVAILPEENSVELTDKSPAQHQAVTMGPLVMTAREFDRIPDTKVKMIQAMHRRNGIVAMTGDGVNDSPSLKFADVGIAMGMAGSDVAKQASEIILTDDNFATIVRAVREGRRVFSNIQRFCCVLVAGNVGELSCLLLGLAFSDTNGETVFPLSPVAILVNNLLTGTPPAMALGVEKAWPTIMDEPPRSTSSGLFSWEVQSDIVFYGLSIGMLSIVDFWLVISGFGNGDMGEHCNMEYNDSCDLVYRARGTTFATLTIAILLHSYNCRRLRGPMWNWSMIKRFHENKFLFGGFISGTILCIMCLYIPGLNTRVLKLKGISWEWGVVLVTLLVFLIMSELYKLAKRKFLKPIKVATAEQERLQRIWTENTLASNDNDYSGKK